MATIPITDDDERLHPVEDPSPQWSDSLCFTAWDPGTDTLVMTRITVQANAGRATGGFLVWRDGVPVYAKGFRVSEIPATDWDVMAVGGLTYRMLSSGRAWAVQLSDRDGAGQSHLEWHGLGDPVSYEGHPGGALPRAVAWGHYEQTCRVTGDLIVGGQRTRVDGFGQRDHSWGLTHWAGLHQWHSISGVLIDGRGFNVFEVQSHADVTTVTGYLQRQDGSHYVVAARRDLVRSDDGGAERCRVDLELAGGQLLSVSGRRAGTCIPVRPTEDQPVVVLETPMRLEAEGVAGYGIYEHLVTEFD
ncbi:MAG: hypothetical protein ABWZ76_02380 [Acidimicrobiales bacterium]